MDRARFETCVKRCATSVDDCTNLYGGKRSSSAPVTVSAPIQAEQNVSSSLVLQQTVALAEQLVESVQHTPRVRPLGNNSF